MKVNSIYGRAGSSRKHTITIEENENFIENLICSQEDNTVSHITPRKVEKKNTSLSRTSVKKYEKWKRIKAVQAFEDNHDEFRCAGKTSKKRRAFGDRFRKSRSVEKYVRQDEKDFTLDVPLQSQNSLFYGFENKDNIQNNRFFPSHH